MYALHTIKRPSDQTPHARKGRLNSAIGTDVSDHVPDCITTTTASGSIPNGAGTMLQWFCIRISDQSVLIVTSCGKTSIEKPKRYRQC